MLRKSQERNMFSSVLLHLAGISAFAFLLLLLEGTAQPCPPMCQFCSADSAECEQISSLQAVLIGLPNFTEKIVLRRGNLSEIPPLSFQNFPNLHFLTITGFPVSSLTDLAFSTVPVNSLRSLDLSNNHLLSCSIEPMTFSGLRALEELTLNNNSLDTLHSPWFLGLFALSKLSLALNRISYLPPRMFENLAGLEELVISSNQIQYLSMDTFYGLVSLARLDLSNNKILFVNIEVFHPLQALRLLLLFDNKLTALPVLPSSIATLFLHANPWDCSCQLVNVVASWGDRIQESAQVLCSTPASLRGHQVTSAKLEGCSSPSFASESNLSSQTVLNLSLLYGFLGGIFIGFVVCMVFCCFLKHCKCPLTNQAENQKCFLSKFTQISSQKAPAALAEIRGNLPVLENAMVDSEAINLTQGSCDHSCNLSSTYKAEQTGTRAQRPLVALLLMDKVTNKAVVTLCEKGSETRGASLNQSLRQTQEEWVHRTNQTPKFLSDPGQQRFAHGERQFHGSPFQHGTSNRMERTEYVFPVVGWCADTQVDGRTSNFDAAPLPQASIHVDLPAGSAVKIQRDGNVVRATSSQRNNSLETGLNASHGQSETAGRTSSPVHCYLPNFASPNWAETSERRWGQDSFVEKRGQDGFMERRQEDSFVVRRHLKGRARNWELPQNAGNDSKGNRTRLSKSSRKPLRHLSRVSSYEITPASSLSSSSSFYSVASQPREYTNLPPCLSTTHQTKKRNLEYKKPRRKQADPDSAMAREASTREELWKCPICRKSYPSAIAQSWLCQPADAPVSSNGLLDAASRPLSSCTAPLKDRETAQALSILDRNAKKLPAKDLSGSSPLPNSQLPFGTPHSGPNKGKEESVDDCANSAPGTALTHQTSGRDIPVAEKTVTQLIIEDEGGVGMVHTLTEIGSLKVHSVMTGNVRSLGEEMYKAQAQAETLVHTLDEFLADHEKAWVDTSSDMTQLSSCSSRTSDSVAGEPRLPEATNITSSSLLVQRLFQIDFPLLDEE